MKILFLGVALWAVAHLVLSACPAFKRGIVGKYGEGLFKAGFSLIIILSMALMVYGWRVAASVPVYNPPLFGTFVPLLLMAVSVFLFGAARRQTVIKQYIRHPQLLGVAVWAIAHLSANGDRASLILFGGMLVWAGLEVVFINRRDGAWVKPAKPTIQAELKGLVITVVVFMVLAYLHPWFAGVPVNARG